jgi:hypothetical protein
VSTDASSGRLPAAAQRAPARAAHHGGRHVVHRLNISLALYGVDYESGPSSSRRDGLHDRRRPFTWKLVVALAIIVPRCRPLTGSSTRRVRGRRCAPSPGHRGVGDDGDQRQPDDLVDVLPRRLARGVAGLVYFLEFQVRYDTASSSA